MVINIDVSTLRRYWLTIAATVVGIWGSLNPAAQQSVMTWLSQHLHGHTLLAGLVTIILADLKQSPIAPTPAPSPAPAPPVPAA
jgi:hypothetical protein